MNIIGSKYFSRAPMRVSLAGGGTDLPSFIKKYDGCVVNFTINRYAYSIIEITDNKEIELSSIDQDEKIKISFKSNKLDKNLILHRAVYFKIRDTFCNGNDFSHQLSTFSEAPKGSGLGGSSALVVSMIACYLNCLSKKITKKKMVKLAFEIEREICNFSGGYQDYVASVYGGLNFITFSKDGNFKVTPIVLNNNNLAIFESYINLYFTGGSRNSSDIIDNQLAAIDNNDKTCVTSLLELKRLALEVNNALIQNEYKLLLDLLKKSSRHKNKTSSLVNNDQTKKIININDLHNEIAIKISGAGGGGFILIFCDFQQRKILNKFFSKKEYQTLFKPKVVFGGYETW